MYRDIGYYWMRLAIYIAIALGLGAMFAHLGSSYASIQVIHKNDENSYFKKWTNLISSLQNIELLFSFFI